MTQTHFLQRPEGRIAYDLTGTGPLVVLVPGMGDLRSTYRFLAPPLVAAGFRVVTTDLRGHGESDASFTAYGDAATADDLAALLDELGEPAVVVGNSMAAGSAVLLAARRPEAVKGLALLGPFVRDGSISMVQRMMLRIAMATPWAALSWKAYAPKLYAGRRPTDLDAYLATVIASLRRPGYAKAFARTTRTSHADAEAALGQVSAPTLIVMGQRDPDFPDPRVEADWIAAALNGDVVMADESGHYPQSQEPEFVAEAVGALARRVNADA
jgi:pimeloyl-ACP methyl ester carboxylesterase